MINRNDGDNNGFWCYPIGLRGFFRNNNMTMVMINKNIAIKYSHKTYISNEINQIGKESAYLKNKLSIFIKQ